MSDRYIPIKIRRRVLQAAGEYCEYCLTPARYIPDPLTFDHIFPRALGGRSIFKNLARCCYGCNQLKAVQTSALDPLTELSAPLFQPREQRWEEHFTWNSDFTRMIGLTPPGRATIAALQLNRAGLVNLRGLLHAFGKHPPR